MLKIWRKKTEKKFYSLSKMLLKQQQQQKKWEKIYAEQKMNANPVEWR